MRLRGITIVNVDGVKTRGASVEQLADKLFISGTSITTKGVPTDDPKTRVIISAHATPREKGETVLTAIRKARRRIWHPWPSWARYEKRYDQWIGMKYRAFVKHAKSTYVLWQNDGTIRLIILNRDLTKRHLRPAGFEGSRKPDIVLHNPSAEELGKAIERALAECE